MYTLIDKKEIGRRIAILRKAKDLNQEDIAARMGLNRTTITQIERGNRDLTAVELGKLAEILNFSIDKLFSDDFSVEIKKTQKRKEKGKETGRKNFSP